MNLIRKCVEWFSVEIFPWCVHALWEWANWIACVINERSILSGKFLNDEKASQYSQWTAVAPPAIHSIHKYQIPVDSMSSQTEKIHFLRPTITQIVCETISMCVGSYHAIQHTHIHTHTHQHLVIVMLMNDDDDNINMNWKKFASRCG